MYLINRHLLKSAAGPFVFGWFVITFLLMIDVLYRYVDLFVSKGVPFLLATRVLALSLGHTFALSVPMAVLIAVLMSIGQLAADHEITALKASGISLWSVLRPLVAGAALVAVGLTAYNHYVFPDANHTLANLLYDINHKRPMLEIQEQRFTEMNDRLTIFVRSKDDLTGRIEDVTIFEKEKPGDLSPRLTLAAHGRIVPEHATDSMLIELYDGESHERPDKEEPDKYQVIRFARQDLIIENLEEDFRESGRTARGDREMDLSDLMTAAREEREHQRTTAERTAEVTGTFLDWQWRLLDPDRRVELLGAQAAPADSAGRANHLGAKFRVTRQQADRMLEQTRYQTKLRHSYEIKESKYLVEFHKKFAIPFACIVFAVLGVPMAVTSSRSGRGVSISLALGVFLVYYLFLMGGEKMADRGKLDPAVAMWSANVVLLALGLPLLVRTVREGRAFSFGTLGRRPAGEGPDGGGAGDGAA